MSEELRKARLSGAIVAGILAVLGLHLPSWSVVSRLPFRFHLLNNVLFCLKGIYHNWSFYYIRFQGLSNQIEVRGWLLYGNRTEHNFRVYPVLTYTHTGREYGGHVFDEFGSTMFKEVSCPLRGRVNQSSLDPFLLHEPRAQKSYVGGSNTLDGMLVHSLGLIRASSPEGKLEASHELKVPDPSR